MVDVTSGLYRVYGVGDVPSVMSQRSMPSVSSLALTLRISSIISDIVEGSEKSENKGRGWTDPTSSFA